MRNPWNILFGIVGGLLVGFLIGDHYQFAKIRDETPVTLILTDIYQRPMVVGRYRFRRECEERLAKIKGDDSAGCY